MQQLPTLDLLRRAVRYAICTRCEKRPVGSDLFSSAISRSCQRECMIFANLPRLAKIAYDSGRDETICIEDAMREQICINCYAAASAGEHCGRRLSRDCPLSIYALDEVGLIEPILASRRNVEI
jgi:hypothetical protein